VTTELALRSRRVVTDDGIAERVVIIRAGKIAAVVAPGDPRAMGVDTEDLGDLVLMPGLVDCHVHINEPGRTEWEGFETATRAAAAGGVTTLIDMPLNSTPVTTTADALAQKLAACEGKLWVDCGFWGGVVPGNVAGGELAGLAKAGALGCKAFMVHSGIDDFPDVGERELRSAMPELLRAGIPLLVHAELELPTVPDERAPQRYGRYLASRPPAWEEAAIELMIRLCRETGCPVHVVHLSSAGALPMIAHAKREGLPFSVETCPHYLCLRAEDIPDGATAYKCAPPIREDSNRAELWRGLRDGIVDLVVTDHSPCTPALKLPERGDFLEAWGGIASLGLGLPAVWSEARARGHSLEEVARWMSRRPAELAGIGNRKGRIAPGYDADLVAWDPDASFTPEAGALHQRHKVTPYLGRTLSGRVATTWLAGERVFEREVHIGTPRGKKLLGREAST
jgi:allantoinase